MTNQDMVFQCCNFAFLLDIQCSFFLRTSALGWYRTDVFPVYPVHIDLCRLSTDSNWSILHLLHLDKIAKSIKIVPVVFKFKTEKLGTKRIFIALHKFRVAKGVARNMTNQDMVFQCCNFAFLLDIQCSFFLRTSALGWYRTDVFPVYPVHIDLCRLSTDSNWSILRLLHLDKIAKSIKIIPVVFKFKTEKLGTKRIFIALHKFRVAKGVARNMTNQDMVFQCCNFAFLLDIQCSFFLRTSALGWYRTDVFPVYPVHIDLCRLSTDSNWSILHLLHLDKIAKSIKIVPVVFKIKTEKLGTKRILIALHKFRIAKGVARNMTNQDMVFQCCNFAFLLDIQCSFFLRTSALGWYRTDVFPVYPVHIDLCRLSTDSNWSILHLLHLDKIAKSIKIIPVVFKFKTEKLGTKRIFIALHKFRVAKGVARKHVKPGHGLPVLQFRFSIGYPVQFLPPYIGLGLVQNRRLSCVPCPHRPLQTVH